jgi:hypothetical protein
MTDDILKKLNTTGAFDTPWLKEQLQSWSVIREQRKADFMEHMYQCSGRQDGLYSGLWQEFCIREAGPYCREDYFRRLQFVKDLEEGKFKDEEMLVS